MSLFLLFALLTSPAQAAKSVALVTCELQNAKICEDCKTRIPASCEERSFNGSLDIKTQPQKLVWLVSNDKNGTEQRLTKEISGIDLGDLKTESDLRALIKKQKLNLKAHEKASLAAVQIPASTALFKAQTGTSLAAQMTPASPKRMVASDSVTAGGVRRAQKSTPSKKEKK